MKIIKKDLAEMERCYAVAVMNINDKPNVFYATEGKGKCIAFDCASLSEEKVIWNEPGGTMNIVPLPGSEDFLAIQKFFRLYDHEEAELVWAKSNGDGTYEIKTLFVMPYIHRFDILEVSGVNYLICCTLADHKATREDWSYPGKVYVGILPKDLNDTIHLEVLMDNMVQNHGFSKVEWKGRQSALITSALGAFIVTPPGSMNSDWNVEKIMGQPISDAAMIDIDGDGEMEIATIEQFHGNYYRIYKKINDQYQMIYEHEETTEFYHVVKSGTVCGCPIFIGGCRRGKQQLFLVKNNIYEKDKLDTILIDEGVGPSNATVANLTNGDYIFSANREAALATVYKIEDL